MQNNSIPPTQGQMPTRQVVTGGIPISTWTRVVHFVLLHKFVISGCILLIVVLAASILYWTNFIDNKNVASKSPTTQQEGAKSDDKTDTDNAQPTTQNPPTEQNQGTNSNTSTNSSGGGQGGSTGNGPSSSTGGSNTGSTNGSNGSQSSGSSCALPKYPDASCTGVPAGTVLSAYTGPSYITSKTTIDGKLINGCLTISVAGVVIKNSKIVGNCQYLVDATGFSGTWLTIQDSELDCGQHGGTTAIGEIYVNALRNNIHGCENGFDVDGHMLIADNYIHDLYQIGGCNEPGPHTDGIQTWPNGTDITIQHNTIYAYSTTQEQCGNAAIINGTTGMTNVTIKENLLAGGNYTLYCGNSNTLQIINNHFSRIFTSKVGEYGPWTDCTDDILSGNVYHETGLPVPPA